MPIQLPRITVLDLRLHRSQLLEDPVHLVRRAVFSQLLAQLVLLPQKRPDRRHRHLQVLQHGLAFRKLGLLGNVPHGEPVLGPDDAVVLLVLAGHQPQQG